MQSFVAQMHKRTRAHIVTHMCLHPTTGTQYKKIYTYVVPFFPLKYPYYYTFLPKGAAAEQSGNLVIDHIRRSRDSEVCNEENAGLGIGRPYIRNDLFHIALISNSYLFKLYIMYLYCDNSTSITYVFWTNSSC